MDIYKIALSCALLYTLPDAHAQDACQPIKQIDPKETDITITELIEQPGRYCLPHDITSPRLYDIHGEKYASSPIIQISSSNVEIDLQKHSLTAETGGMSGILLPQTDRQGQLPSHISIRNGTVSTRTMGGIELAFREGSLLADFMTKYSGDMRFSKKDYEQLEKISAGDYPLTENIIDSIKIQANTSEKNFTAGLVGIGMRGKGNVVRNSTIVMSNGHAAIYLFGPNNIIENNIIIFKGKSAYESAAAIKLHHSNGTVVRNNDIVVDSSPETAPAAAISVIDSKDVVIENNRVYGLKTLAKMWDDKSSTIMRNNEMRNLLSAPSMRAEPGVQ
ncbi:right-handed parallel beta-helix repeat-containing protein [Massilia sp. IC2-278]|uniref:right-handed parallel beta-helix repeat-containing protein n=1 Tax=Massilia sp. IC2-278 TaxID=2887200 RepID=UPI001E3E8374|nr:right-handed parallel beta-helix repeat-containing protein [Massilia sp. IC2-278]MCC2961286.1 right-handed parallel beta-helix repeat-containing protein [Massilia sp. IC2-278]